MAEDNLTYSDADSTCAWSPAAGHLTRRLRDGHPDGILLYQVVLSGWITNVPYHPLRFRRGDELFSCKAPTCRPKMSIFQPSALLHILHRAHPFEPTPPRLGYGYGRYIHVETQRKHWYLICGKIAPKKVRNSSVEQVNRPRLKNHPQLGRWRSASCTCGSRDASRRRRAQL